MRVDGLEGREAGGKGASEAAVERRLSRLRTACSVPAAAGVAASAAIVWTAEGRGAEGWLGSPPTESFVMALGALLVVLLASAARARILRRAREEGLGEADAAGGWLGVYSRATAVHFAMLAVAVALGGMVALRGRAPFYGLVICLASLLSMTARWPRRAGLAVAMDEDGPGARQ
jgi:hypothetical protein